MEELHFIYWDICVVHRTALSFQIYLVITELYSCSKLGGSVWCNYIIIQWRYLSWHVSQKQSWPDRLKPCSLGFLYNVMSRISFIFPHNHSSKLSHIVNQRYAHILSGGEHVHFTFLYFNLAHWLFYSHFPLLSLLPFIFSTILKEAFLVVEQTGIFWVLYIRLDFNEQMNECDNSLDSRKHYLLGMHFNSEGWLDIQASFQMEISFCNANPLSHPISGPLNMNKLYYL